MPRDHGEVHRAALGDGAHALALGAGGEPAEDPQPIRIGQRPEEVGHQQLLELSAVGGGECGTLARLCHGAIICPYIARPPIATERLELTPDGNVRYHFRKPWRKGTAYVDYSPLELIERLAVLVPAPRGHLLVYHGLLAPNAARRARIVPEPAEPESPVAQCPESAT